ncbi:hypothetical protein VB773_16025 [Haloarculaceae archaeon H-GB2-1]|nr:hypothetical protein [Haloarculaceae archaeon H-GB1-1]MEA5387446.1 hypothetical protein [Haloarculaceae archaeon H-GB11]MEA5408923.1 hypothetical protein [Haloarculaceae archaeon H-GB2-1]
MPSQFAARIDELATAASEAAAEFEPPADPPDEERAMEFLREGLGPTIVVYLDARTGGGSPVEFGTEEFRRLERTTNTWLDLYAACYGVDLDAEFTVRKAAELLMETHNVKDVAQLLTDVPARH